MTCVSYKILLVLEHNPEFKKMTSTNRFLLFSVLKLVKIFFQESLNHESIPNLKRIGLPQPPFEILRH